MTLERRMKFYSVNVDRWQNESCKYIQLDLRKSTFSVRYKINLLLCLKEESIRWSQPFTMRWFNFHLYREFSVEQESEVIHLIFGVLLFRYRCSWIDTYIEWLQQFPNHFLSIVQTDSDIVIMNVNRSVQFSQESGLSFRWPHMCLQ